MVQPALPIFYSVNGTNIVNQPVPSTGHLGSLKQSRAINSVEAVKKANKSLIIMQKKPYVSSSGSQASIMYNGNIPSGYSVTFSLAKGGKTKRRKTKTKRRKTRKTRKHR